MSIIENDNLYLSEEESENLINSLLNPNRNNFDKRNAFLSSINRVSMEYREDGTAVLDIPELVLMSSNSMIDCLQKVIGSRDICYKVEMNSISVNYSRERYNAKREIMWDESYYSQTKNIDIYCESCELTTAA